MEIEKLYEIFKSHQIISTDTRKIEKHCLFFALKGDNFNGNKFAVDAIEKGAAYAIIDEKEYRTSDQYILVGDVLKTLQELANYHRKQLNIPIIGITGTNGKTTTKELINVVISKKYRTSATTGNLNNHIGVPLTLLSIPSNCEMAIIEMGANHIGEIDFLCKIAEPNYGIITNIGTAHIEGFGSYEGVKKTKNELYVFIQKVHGKVFVNNTDELLMKLSENIESITYGNENADCSAELIQSSPNIKLKWQDIEINSHLYGDYNFYNILAAICIGHFFDVDKNDIREAINNYKPSNNRSQIIEINSNVIYLDAYNANPTSMNAAIDTFSKNPAANRLMILGDMLELGDISKQEHQKVIDKVKDLKIRTLFVGNQFSSAVNKYNFTYMKNADDVIKWLNDNAIHDHNILIKGSRGIRLETIIEHI